MRVPDSAMPVYYDLLLDGAPDDGRPPVELKRAMARELTARFHGAGAAAEAEAHFDRLHVAREAPDEVEELALPGGDGAVHLPALLGEAFGLSRSEARRLLEQGGVRAGRRAGGRRRAGRARRSASTGPCCRWASGASGACAKPERKACSAADPALYCPVPLHEKVCRVSLGGLFYVGERSVRRRPRPGGRDGP